MFPNSAGAARRAGPEDAAALARLRAVMLDSLAQTPPATGDRDWTRETAAWFAEQLLDGEHFAAYLVDDPKLGPVACAVGSVRAGPPRPGGLDQRSAEVFSVATHPDARRRGRARACMTALLSWIDELGIPRTRLTATPDAVALYHSLGFAAQPWTPMARSQKEFPDVLSDSTGIVGGRP